MRIHTNIVLIGMPGSGKTSLGLLIAEKLGIDFCDIDQYIQKKENKSISELFLLGESHFRQVESDAVSEVSSKGPLVIATGGGVVTRLENVVLLQQTGTIFYIERPIDMIIKSTDFTERPLLADNVKRIYKLYDQRKHLYEESCHYRVSNEMPLNSVVELMLKMIE